MLVVTVQLWPHGSYEDRQTLDSLVIINDGTGNAKEGNYRVSFLLDEENPAEVHGYRRSDGPWHLVRRSLDALMPDHAHRVGSSGGSE